MRTVNKVILIGNVTRDPSIKNTENNKKIALFTLATNRYYKTSEGENKSESEFHNCVAWGNLAERIESFLLKGKLIYVEGRLRTRVIEKDENNKIYKTEVVVSNLIFLNKRSDFDGEVEDLGIAHDLVDDEIDVEDKF
ncbi:single-stranded DNA-binding protein [Candidatus Gracilibacteria bacterium]|nr:single-stranded DNA-binding protein [Candidatus Gracilibacteria bacterium]NUJ98656.1 single-stranded DNA-binding protein [Candidatus Gracilibacteria bacterium]